MFLKVMNAIVKNPQILSGFRPMVKHGGSINEKLTVVSSQTHGYRPYSGKIFFACFIIFELFHFRLLASQPGQVDRNRSRSSSLDVDLDILSTLFGKPQELLLFSCVVT